MTPATVASAGTNEASRALYEACGFTPWHLIDDYVKPIPARRDKSGA
jgi:RimJ/RimL family protein N-acetyltransferase